MIGVTFTDNSGSKNYYFLRNLQGDVIAIYNSSGELAVEYVYDAFGNCQMKNVYDSVIAKYNPIRYRGYYYDDETGFYYCNSRYYNPEWGRWISPDDTAYLNSETPDGLNLYVYCNNNPIGAMFVARGGDMINAGNIQIGSYATFGTSQSTNVTNNMTGIVSKGNQSRFNLFGYELRTSAGWNNSPYIATGWFGRIGFSSYTTRTQGRSGMLYAFAGSTSDIMNWFGTTYYAGIGINLFDIIGVEAQLETLGSGLRISIGNFSISTNINLIGGTSITVGYNTDLGNGNIETKGVTVGINTGFLVAVIAWIYKVVTTGDPTPMPGLQPA